MTTYVFLSTTWPILTPFKICCLCRNGGILYCCNTCTRTNCDKCLGLDGSQRMGSVESEFLCVKCGTDMNKARPYYVRFGQQSRRSHY